MLRYPLAHFFALAIGTASIRRGKKHDPVRNSVYRTLARFSLPIQIQVIETLALNYIRPLRSPFTAPVFRRIDVLMHCELTS